MKAHDKVEDVVCEKETTTSTQCMVAAFDEKVERYVTVATYNMEKDALRYANMVAGNRNVFVVSRRVVIKKTIVDNVVEVIESC